MYLIGVGIFQIVRKKIILWLKMQMFLYISDTKAGNLNEYLHVYPSHSLGKKTTGFSETIQDNYTQLKKETFTL